MTEQEMRDYIVGAVALSQYLVLHTSGDKHAISHAIEHACKTVEKLATADNIQLAYQAMLINTEMHSV